MAQELLVISGKGDGQDFRCGSLCGLGGAQGAS